ncbi:MAG TPA: hypothetical protein VGH73_12920, partial [Thermoanaerobaculia bacterium]
MNDRRLSAAAAARIVWTLFAAGLLIALVMLVRSQVAGDQLNLLARGWLLAARGTWISYGNPMSSGGKSPGGITSLLVGLPLLLWRDHRAPSALVLLFHVAAYLILDGSLKRILSPLERVLLALFYWLNPWQLYFASFLWNPNYLYLFGAIHLWSALAQRERARFWPSFLHAAALVLAFQVHASFLLLAVASLLLAWRRYFRVHWTGAVLGGTLAAIPLVPWAIDVMAHPTLITAASKGFLGRGLILVYPLARGLLYWVRYASLAVAERMGSFNFADLLGSDSWLGSELSALGNVLAVTAVLSLLANVRLWRHGRRRLRGRLAPGTSDRSWLKGYARVCFAAAVIVFSLSPTTIMLWQGLILFHAAILPMVLWGGALGRSRLAPWVMKATWGYAVLEIAFLVAMALGSSQYRCAGHTGDDGFGFNLRYDSPMLRELHIQQTCPWPVGVPGGWWPDVLP